MTMCGVRDDSEKKPRAARGATGAGYNIMPPAGTGLSRLPLPHARHLPSTANGVESRPCPFPIPHFRERSRIKSGMTMCGVRDDDVWSPG